MTVRDELKKYLDYIVNTGSNVDVAGFDEDWEPVGPMVRAELMARYIIEGPTGKLVLTDEGRAAIATNEGAPQCPLSFPTSACFPRSYRLQS